MRAWLQSLEREEVTYWVGLALLFTGLTIRVSIATALIVTGAVIALESVVTSYLATWLTVKSEAKK